MKKSIRKFDPRTYWRNIEVLGKEAGMSPAEVSTFLGLSESYISSGKNQGSDTKLSNALAFADLFEVSVEELAYEDIGKEMKKQRLMGEIAKLEKELAALEEPENNGGK